MTQSTLSCVHTDDQGIYKSTWKKMTASSTGIKRHFRIHVSIAAMCAAGVALNAYGHQRDAAADYATEPREPAAREIVVRDLPLGGGAYQRVMFDGPSRKMRGVIVMFPGGAGDVGIERNGDVRHGDNFVVRTRDLWAQRSYGVVIVDAIGHQSMRGLRSTAMYADVATRIVAFAHEVSNAPVWVMGTSQGSIAAMSAASHAEPGQVAGVVLTESVSILGHSHETVFDAHPESVRVPALVVANQDDECKVAPPSMAEKIARSMRDAPTTVMMEQGGSNTSSNACSSLSPHGYYGIEPKVVNDIAGWMEGESARPTVEFK
jgi:pimeloyl-ACP methyl ester carboxylesterase